MIRPTGSKLVLPDDLEIVRDTKQERELVVQSRAWLEREPRSPGVHASDLLDPRQAYWRAVSPKPISDRVVPTFLIGKVLHAILLSVVDQKDLDMTSDEGSRESESLGIVYSPDLLRGEPIEIKTSRSFFEPKSLKDIAMYCEQLLIYMAATNNTRGHLWVLYLNLKDDQNRTAPEFRVYTIEVPKQALDHYARTCRTISDEIKLAIEKRQPTSLPLCRDWKCTERMCEWWHECQPEGRYEKGQQNGTKRRR